MSSAKNAAQQMKHRMMRNLRVHGYHKQGLATVVGVGLPELYRMYAKALVELDRVKWADMYVFENDETRLARRLDNVVDSCRKMMLLLDGEGNGQRPMGRSVQAFNAATEWLLEDLAPGAHDFGKVKISALHTHTVGMGQVHHFDYPEVLHQPVQVDGGCHGGKTELHSPLSLLLPLEGECTLMVDTLATARVSLSCQSCGPTGPKKGCMEYVDVSAAMEGWERPPGGQGMVELTVKKGEVLIFLDRVAHGGGAATSGLNRRLHGYWPTTASPPPDDRVFTLPKHCTCGLTIDTFRGNDRANKLK